MDTSIWDSMMIVVRDKDVVLRRMEDVKVHSQCLYLIYCPVILQWYHDQSSLT